MRMLHLHSTFSAGGKELRAARLINAFGPNVAHTIVSAEPESYGAAKAIQDRIKVNLHPQDFPSLKGKPTPGRLQKLARAMQGYDLVLTYNWGAMDAVLAHTVYRKAFSLPPLVHHEDGFNHDEADGMRRSRIWFRRIALGGTSMVIVPSQKLENIALKVWQQPAGKVKRISNGVDVTACARKPKADAIPRLVKRPRELWLGTLAGLRPVKNLPLLVRAFSHLPEPWQLVILGEGPERDVIRAEVERLDLVHRVHLPGFVPNPERITGLFDLYALSSNSEQFPISVVEAMAAGIAVASPAVGDVAEMVASENAPFITPLGDEAALADALVKLANDEGLRRSVGAANQIRARAEFDEKAMIATYRRIYANAMRRPSLP